MVAKLIVEEGDLKGLSLSLEEGETWTIGRDSDECQLVIEDPLVSRKHLRVRRTSNGFVVENLSDTNSALINDEELMDQPHLLQNGDTLKIGNEVLRFYADTSAQVLGEALSYAQGLDMNEIEDSPKDEIEENDMPDVLTNEIESSSTDERDNSPTPERDIPMSNEQNLPMPDAALPAAAPLTTRQADRQDTIFGDENDQLDSLAEIDFGVIETGRWLLKVISGPNNGAEFYMQAGNPYVVGTDPQSCDIVFHDTSVSRQHARITVSLEDTLSIEDLKSRNGVLINGESIEGKQNLSPNSIVTLGTTSFVIYDREGEMQTIISPLLPSIVKVLQQEPAKTEGPSTPRPTLEESEIEKEESAAAPVPQPIEAPPPPKPRSLGPYIILTTIIGLFVLAGIGTSTLFREEPIVAPTQENADELLQEALQPFPAIRWTFNKSNGGILLLGHVSTLAEKNQLLYNLGMLSFVKNIDDSGVILDEGVWNEVNSLLASNAAWKGISVYSPAAGQFILSGELQTRKQAEQLSSYLSLNFPYLDLLKKQIVVEEEIVNQIQGWLQDSQLVDSTAKMANGEVTLNGTVQPDQGNDLNEVIAKIKQIPGVRVVTNLIRSQTTEMGITDLSDQYPVTGRSRIGNKLAVVINGRILSEGEDLDGMTITKITDHRIHLENQGGDKFRIDYY